MRFGRYVAYTYLTELVKDVQAVLRPEAGLARG